MANKINRVSHLPLWAILGRTVLCVYFSAVLLLFVNHSLAETPSRGMIPSPNAGTEIAELQDSAVVCKQDDLCYERATDLPLRVLARPFSSVYRVQEASNTYRVTENITAFTPLYVFSKTPIDYSDPTHPQGWYQVGYHTRQALGWMQAKDILEWRQRLVVTYTHPGVAEQEREPVLMFKHLEDLYTLIEDEDEREFLAQELYADLLTGLPAESLISREPEGFVDFAKTPYIMPVIDFRVIDDYFFDIPSARLLQITAAVPQQRSSENDQTSFVNPDYLSQANQQPVLKDSKTQALAIDMVFVMDMTHSMGPFLKQVQHLMNNIAHDITNNDIADIEDGQATIRFGLVGYRDDIRAMPELDFTTRNFTSERLLSAAEFAELLQQGAIREAKISSDDYAEELFAGVKIALDQSPWRGGLRFLVLIGDASGHPSDHPYSTTQLNAAQLRAALTEQGIYLFAFHLQAEGFEPDHPIATAQFTKLASNPGVANSTVWTIAQQELDQFSQKTASVAAQISAVITKIAHGESINPAVLAESSQAAAGFAETLASVNVADNQSTVLQANQVVAAALIEYLGAEPVRDVTFWAFDHDLLDPSKPALEVRVLLTKRELNDLVIGLEQILTALQRSQTEKARFFHTLKSLLSQTTKGLAINFQEASSIAEAQIFPKWIESLPYHSTLLQMTDQAFSSLSESDRYEMDKNLRASLRYYRDILENTDIWLTLDPQNTDSKEQVYPLPLDRLP